MHRLTSTAGEGLIEEFSFVEQPKAPILFLTSATTDIATLDSTLTLPSFADWTDQIRALPISAVEHPAQLDNYLAET